MLVVTKQFKENGWTINVSGLTLNWNPFLATKCLPSFDMHNGLKTNDPRITSRFNQLYRSFLLERNMPICALTLETHATYPLHPTLRCEAEKLDQLKVDGVWHAHQRCRRLFMGNVPFSLE